MENKSIIVTVGAPVSNGGSGDGTVKASITDTTPAFLLQKLISTDGTVSIELNNQGGDENVDLKVVSGSLGSDDISNDSTVVSGDNVTQALENLENRIGLTTAGLLTPVYFTGDEETLATGTYYKTNRDNQGTIATVEQTISVGGNSSAFFGQDLIGDPYPIETTIPKGNYSGAISVGATNVIGVKFNFTAELYLCQPDGTPVNSGTGSPVGDLGVETIAIASTGEKSIGITITEIGFNVTAVLPSELVIPSGYRVRYHISGEKVGANIGASTLSFFIGFDHEGFVAVPIPVTTTSVLNTDIVNFPTEQNQSEINTKLKTDKIDSVTSGEPTGSDKVLNIVSLTQAEYDAGTPNADTFYIIT